MRYIRILLTALLIALSGVAASQTIVPTPKNRTLEEGLFTLNQQVVIAHTEALNEAARYLQSFIGLGLSESFYTSHPMIALSVEPALQSEEYTLDVSSERIVIEGGSYRGVINGIHTLLQLMPAEVYARRAVLPCNIPAQRIEDSPAFPYRGFHLDVARTWMDSERVKRYIERAAFHKLNTLHLHLTDDEGWRIEILSHPELAEVGGFRGGDSPIKSVYGLWDVKYGGYFTQEELREIIRFAEVRGIEIIPEIDLPGHSRTVARIHPEILCQYDHSTTRSAGYDLRNVWCASNEDNYSMLEDILREVCRLFPSKRIHIGGDEVDMSQWSHCPKCQELMRREGMSETQELQQYFMSRLVSIIESEGKTPVVWNEAINGGNLTKSALVHGWESLKACKKSTSEGYRTVVMPGQYFYFDMRQSQHEEGHTWAAIFDAEKVYNFDLTKLGFTAEEQYNVAGFEGTFFSEAYIGHNSESADYLDFMLYPRTVALAELAWHYGEKRWQEFKHSLIEEHYARLSAMGLAFRLFPPKVSYKDGVLSASTDDGSELYYTEYPDNKELPYTKPIKSSHPELYQFRSRLGSGRSPLVAHASFYRTIQPEVKFSSSLPESEKAPFSRLESYKGAAWSTRTHHKGDWLQFTFSAPLTCREVYLQTGYLHLPRCIVWGSEVEVSYDGSTFEKIGKLTAGAITIRPKRAIKAIRVTATQDGNGEERVIIQSLKIKR